MQRGGGREHVGGGMQCAFIALIVTIGKEPLSFVSSFPTRRSGRVDPEAREARQARAEELVLHVAVLQSLLTEVTRGYLHASSRCGQKSGELSTAGCVIKAVKPRTSAETRPKGRPRSHDSNVERVQMRRRQEEEKEE